MVKMYDWSSVLKEKNVTLAGMDKPLERRGFLNRFGARIHDPVDRFGHIKISDMPLRGYTGNYVGPRGKRTFEETSESGRQYGGEPLRGVPGGTTGFGVGAALGSSLGPLGTLAGGAIGGKVGANWRDVLGRGSDNHRMSRMWRAQQAAFKRQQARGNRFFPGRFDGKSPGNAAIADYIWKPGDPFKIYTDKGSQEIQQFMGVNAPLGGSIIQFLNRIIGNIPGLRDPQQIQQQREREERTRKGYKALEYYHKMKSGNPDWQMSDGDKRLVANMMHDFYSSEYPEMDPKQIAMMANGATKWEAKQLRGIHAGLVQYLEQTRAGGNMPPMRPFDVQDEQARAVLEGSEIREDEMQAVAEAMRRVQDRRKGTERAAEEFEEGGPTEQYSDVPLLDVRQAEDFFGYFKPLRQMGDDPTRLEPRWQDKGGEMLLHALNEQKRAWHDDANKENISGRLGDTAEQRIRTFFLHPDTHAQKILEHYMQDDKTNEQKRAARTARHALEQLVNGHLGTAFGPEHAQDHHDYAQMHGTAVLNNIMRFMLQDSDKNDIGIAHASETHNEYDPAQPITYFGASQQPAATEASRFEPGDLSNVYDGHQE